MDVHRSRRDTSATDEMLSGIHLIVARKGHESAMFRFGPSLRSTLLTTVPLMVTVSWLSIYFSCEQGRRAILHWLLESGICQ